MFAWLRKSRRKNWSYMAFFVNRKGVGQRRRGKRFSLPALFKGMDIFGHEVPSFNIRGENQEPDAPAKKGLKQIDSTLRGMGNAGGGAGDTNPQRTITMHSKARKERLRTLAAERVITNARDKEVAIASRNMARAAAKFGGASASVAIDPRAGACTERL